MLGDITTNDIPIYSVNEVLDTYRDYDCSDEAREPILYFISELTGKSVDTLAELLAGRKG